MIPSYLLSPCVDRTSDLCCGCDEAVKQNPEGCRWFITMGHPGFNSAANNGRGFKTKHAAVVSMRWFASRRSSAPAVR